MTHNKQIDFENYLKQLVIDKLAYLQENEDIGGIWVVSGDEGYTVVIQANAQVNRIELPTEVEINFCGGYEKMPVVIEDWTQPEDVEPA